MKRPEFESNKSENSALKILLVGDGTAVVCHHLPFSHLTSYVSRIFLRYSIADRQGCIKVGYFMPFLLSE